MVILVKFQILDINPLWRLQKTFFCLKGFRENGFTEYMKDFNHKSISMIYSKHLCATAEHAVVNNTLFKLPPMFPQSYLNVTFVLVMVAVLQ